MEFRKAQEPGSVENASRERVQQGVDVAKKMARAMAVAATVELVHLQVVPLSGR